jgi:uncharacterized membrane protein YsdA (DUF1294 family)
MLVPRNSHTTAGERLVLLKSISYFPLPKGMIHMLIGYLILVNAVAFLLMLIDKYKAKKNKWRISEATLMGIAAIGGSLGAIGGMYTFRHKTKHPKFTIGLPVILTLQIVLGIWLYTIIK